MKVNHVFKKTLQAAILALVSVSAFAQTQELRIPGPELPAANRSADETRRYNEFNKLLLEMGYLDIPASVEVTLNSPESRNLEKINHDTLVANWYRFQLLNVSRELGSELLSKFTPMLQNPESAAKISLFTARLIAQSRLAIPDAFPDEVNGMENIDQRVAAKENYLRNAVEANIQRMREQLLSDTLHTLYGSNQIQQILKGQSSEAKTKLTSEIQRLDVLVGRYVRGLYFDHELGLGHWLGEALALGLVHTSRTSGNPEVQKFEKLLNYDTFQQGEFLSDVISDTLSFVDADGNVKKVQVKNADIVTEFYAHSLTSRLATSAVRPSGWLNRWKAAKEKVLMPLILAGIAADEDPLIAKASDGKKLKLLDKMRLYFAQLRIARKGNSHGGLAMVKTNPQSKISRISIVDLQVGGPTPFGATRIATPRIFSHPGINSTFGVASLQPQKLLQYLQDEYKTKGYKPEFGITGVFRQNENGVADFVPGETFEWRALISAEEQRKFLDVPMEKANEWFHQGFAKNLVGDMVKNITNYGMAFRPFGTPARKGFCYCTEGVIIAGYNTTGFNLMTKPDDVIWIARLVDKLTKKMQVSLPKEGWLGKIRALADKVQTQYPKDAPISPNFMHWDPKAKSQNLSMYMGSPVWVWLQQLAPPRADMSPELTRTLSPLMNHDPVDTRHIGEGMHAPREFLKTTEVTQIPKGNEANKATFVPRANGAKAASPQGPSLLHNMMAPVPTAQVSEEAATAARKKYTTSIADVYYSDALRLSSTIMSYFGDRFEDGESAKALATLTAKMMALKPINPPREIPHEIKALPQGQRENALARWAESISMGQVESQSRQVVSDMSALLFGKDAVVKAVQNPSLAESKLLLSRIDGLYVEVVSVLRTMYIEVKAADERSLGKSMALILINESKTRQKPEIIANLKEALKVYQLQMEDFFDAELKPLKTGTPGERYVERMTQPRAKVQPSLVEKLQVRYSPYFEAQGDLTRVLANRFAGQPRPASLTLTAGQKNLLFDRVVNQYLTPLYKEQIDGKNGLFSSPMLRANPVAPVRPTIKGMTCEMLLAS